MNLPRLVWLFPVWLVGCFTEPALVVKCPAGRPTCGCLQDGSCSDGLVCSDEVCRNANCRAGQETCICLDGQCLPGLVCIEDSCVPEGGGDGADDGAGSSTTGSTTIAATSNSGGTASSADGGVGVGTANDDGPEPGCACGWDPFLSWYICGEGLEPAAPMDDPPRLCPDLVAPGQCCEDVNIDSIGCCTAQGENVYCALPPDPTPTGGVVTCPLGIVVFEDCLAAATCSSVSPT